MDELSVWEFGVLMRRWDEAHRTEEKIEPPTADEFWDAVERLG